MSRSFVVLRSTSVFLYLSGTLVAPLSSTKAAPPHRQIESAEKPLPPGAIARLGSVRLRHEDEVRAVAFSPDGKKIASVPQGGSRIRVWNTTTGKLLREIDAPGIFSRKIFAPDDYSLAFTPDGKAIAAGVGPDVCFWELASGRQVRRFPGKGKGIVALTFSRDKKSFYCGCSDNKLYQWEMATGKQLKYWDYFKGKQPRIYASGFPEKTAVLKAVCPNGKTAVWLVEHWADKGTGVGKDGWQFIIWDVAMGKDRCQLTDKNDPDFFDASVVLSADGKYLTAYTQNSSMIVWDAANGKKLKTLGNGDSVEAVAYSPDCQRVAAINREDGYSLSLWDLLSGKELWRRQTVPWSPGVQNKLLTFSPSGKRLALAYWNNVLIWDVGSGKEDPCLEGHRWPVQTIVFSLKEGAWVSADGACVCEWDMAHCQKARHSLIAYHGDSRSLAESYETKLRIYQPDGRPPQLRELITDKLLGEFAEVKGTYYNGCFSADGHTVALSRRDKKKEILFLDVPSRKVRTLLTVDEPVGENLVLSGDGKMLAVVSLDETVSLIDSFRGQIVRRLGTPQAAKPKKKGPRVKLTNGAFSPDGRLLAFGTCVERPDDQWKLKVGGLDALPPDAPGIRVWNVATGRELRQFNNCMADAPRGRIASLCFSPDNKSLAVALFVNSFRQGDLERGVVPVLEVASGRLRRRFQGHADQVRAVAFTPDGKVLATGSEDSTILLWDMKRRVRAEPAANKPPAERLGFHWTQLAARDSAEAYDAVLALTETPGQCIPFLAERLRPVKSPSNKELAKWIADLDATSFKVRKQAFAKLVALHETARPALERALKGNVSLEVRRSVGKMLDALNAMNYSPTLMRQLRSVEVLERIGNKKARRLLELIAAGAPEALLTIEAKASLARLKQAL
jgi:WD40 repeat protein